MGLCNHNLWTQYCKKLELNRVFTATVNKTTTVENYPPPNHWIITTGNEEKNGIS